MRFILILTIFCYAFCGCKSKAKKEGRIGDSKKSADQVMGMKFFEYDAIDYYSNDIDQSKLGDLYDNQSKSEIDSFRMGIILGDIPKRITDLAFLDKLEKIGYRKASVDKFKFKNIDKIFVEKKVTENIGSGCIYVFRDILVFKKDSKVIGTAKVCFGCWSNQIHGTTANTDNFGQDGDYGKLAELLRP